jgi:hypothetical protein
MISRIRRFDRSGLAPRGPLFVPQVMPRRRMPRPLALPIVIATTPWSRFMRRVLRLLGRP